VTTVLLNALATNCVVAVLDESDDEDLAPLLIPHLCRVTCRCIASFGHHHRLVPAQAVARIDKLDDVEGGFS